MSDINWYIYRPSSKYRASFSGRYCAASVADDYGVDFHQCNRAPKHKLWGFGWCTQHFKKLPKEPTSLTSEQL